MATASLDIDPTNAGSDVTISIVLGYGASFNGGAPTVGSTPNGTGLNINLLTSSTSSIATIRFDFHYMDGIRDLQMMTNDIDLNSLRQSEELRALYGTLDGGSKLAGVFALGAQTTATGLAGSGLSASLYGLADSTGASSNAMLSMASQVDYLQMTYGLRPSYTTGTGQTGFSLGNITWSTGAASLPPPTPTAYGETFDNPEPATYILMATGLLGMAFARRRAAKR